MKMDQIDKAAKLVEQYERAKKQAEWVKNARWFRVGAGPSADTVATLAGLDGCSIEQGDSYGALALDLKAAAKTYCQHHVDLLANELKKLGVEVV